MENQLQPTGSAFDEMLAALKAQQDAIDAAAEQTGSGAVYVRGLHAMSEASHEHGEGTMEIAFSSDEKLYATVVAVYPIEHIGTVSEKAKENPTPREWLTPHDNAQIRDTYGRAFCMSSGNFAPDPFYVDPEKPQRVFTHPDANGRTAVEVSAGYNSQKTVTVPMTQAITKDLDCRECVFGRAMFSTDGALLVQHACRPKFSGVFQLMGASGIGLFGPEKRAIAAVNMTKQAARAMFSRQKKKNGQLHNDTKFQQEIGIVQPFADMIANKGLDSLPANMVMVPTEVETDGGVTVMYQRVTFPFLLASKVHAYISSQTGQRVTSIIPFLFNPADSVRSFMKENPGVTDQLEQRLLFQIASDMMRHVNVKNAESFIREIADLLRATMSKEGDPSETLMNEYVQLRSEYLTPVKPGVFEGRVKLTTPFQHLREQENEGTPHDAQIVAPPVGVAPTQVVMSTPEGGTVVTNIPPAQPVITPAEQELIQKTENLGEFSFESFQKSSDFGKDWTK